MSDFFGQYEHQLDEKGRVSLPSAFRSGEEGERFVLLQYEPHYLALYPDARWQELKQGLLEFRKSDPANWNAVREMLAKAVAVTPDKQGRVLVPVGLKESAKLQGTVLLIGNLDRVELWSARVYRENVVVDPEVLNRHKLQIFG